MSGERPRARDDVVFRALAREWVAYDPASGHLHVMNVTAALVWTLCDGEREVDVIVREVRQTLDEAPSEERVRADVAEALEVFRTEGLLE